MAFMVHGVLGGPRSKKRIIPKIKQQNKEQEVFKEESTIEVIIVEEVFFEEIDPILEEDKDYNPLEDFDFQVPFRARKKNKKSKKS
jgi:hypothetical protein